MTSTYMLQDEKGARAVLPEPVVRYIEACRKSPRPASHLISVLHRVQQHCGYLGKPQMDAVSTLMQIPSAKVTSVASFYHFFKFQPKGKHTLTVCLGTACYVRGSGRILERLEERLGVKPGQTTADGQFSLEAARCLGACALAPVVVVNERVYAGVTVAQIDKILTDYGFDPAARPV
jgi:NADH:ubiquinone oxidoreductase subunit E